LALCVHAFIDIDFHVSGLTAAAALTWALMGRHPTQKGSRNEPVLLTVIATALLLWGAFACLTPGG
jgi:crotonobetainyl-CoA:carnitine CoA-transferase CaiB-like acyl-CoA transferase